MNYPEMILFDYGNTLINEFDFNTLRGYKAVFEHVVRNPKNVAAETVTEFDSKLYKKLENARNGGYELHEKQLNQITFEYFGLEFDVPLEEIELIYWTNASPTGIMPHTDKMLDYINSHGIRSGVVSNISWSGNALKSRIDTCLPNNRFEFVISSSEYIFRKPDPVLFELALAKADISPDKVWFCGDTVEADIFGAHGVGIFPVWYEEDSIPVPWRSAHGKLPDFDYMHIHDWRELITALENLKVQSKSNL